ncbi:NADH:ubiquinone oxidoreductase subunit N [Bacillus sp. FJAT-18017]|uniref:NADH-quinone oxidoreductase subunit NuoN n=1 Tax=Bacillus sp. FJAT-18017 TaxID=1705566 RepID=UPI0006AF3142|nr:NADH-quinone oxidoreductase subunit NuoN [Bacillus sp. FJAT-18017]ALC88728.1 NADH:ubiquinone oxidoreductase subunit N [Bacillus sp. FJAT-18017]
MDLNELLSYEWGAMMPEFIILGTAALLTLIDLFMPKENDRKIFGWIAIAAIASATISLAGLIDAPVTSILADTFRLDSFAKAFKFILLIGSALVMLLAIQYNPKDGFEEYKGEFFYLFLTALLGSMIMASSGDLITLFVGLETLSISSYILAGMRKNRLDSNESAMKYVINGSIATAITLFGMSYVYGLSGSTNLREIAGVLQMAADSQHIYLLGIAFFMIFIGLSFKIAAAPYHMWAPDVYQGAPTPVTAFLSVVSKTAGFIIIIRIMLSVFGVLASEGPNSMPLLLKLQDYIAFLAGATMIIGNVVALRQRNIKRLFAYSSIAHAGYVLVAFSTLSYFMFDAVWFYLLAYVFMNVGAFAVIQLITEKTGTTDTKEFAGLYKKAPLLAVAFGILILSLAGFPGTAGFIGKVNIFMSTFVDPVNPHYVLASVMIATTVVSYVYYFGILTQMFFRPAQDESAIKTPVVLSIAIAIAVAGSVLFGLLPNVALDFLHEYFNGFSDFLS